MSGVSNNLGITINSNQPPSDASIHAAGIRLGLGAGSNKGKSAQKPTSLASILLRGEKGGPEFGSMSPDAIRAKEKRLQEILAKKPSMSPGQKAVAQARFGAGAAMPGAKPVEEDDDLEEIPLPAGSTNASTAKSNAATRHAQNIPTLAEFAVNDHLEG